MAVSASEISPAADDRNKKYNQRHPRLRPEKEEPHSGRFLAAKATHWRNSLLRGKRGSDKPRESSADTSLHFWQASVRHFRGRRSAPQRRWYQVFAVVARFPFS